METLLAYVTSPEEVPRYFVVALVCSRRDDVTSGPQELFNSLTSLTLLQTFILNMSIYIFIHFLINYLFLS